MPTKSLLNFGLKQVHIPHMPLCILLLDTLPKTQQMAKVTWCLLCKTQQSHRPLSGRPYPTCFPTFLMGTLAGFRRIVFSLWPLMLLQFEVYLGGGWALAGYRKRSETLGQASRIILIIGPALSHARAWIFATVIRSPNS